MAGKQRWVRGGVFRRTREIRVLLVLLLATYLKPTEIIGLFFGDGFSSDPNKRQLYDDLPKHCKDFEERKKGRKTYEDKGITRPYQRGKKRQQPTDQAPVAQHAQPSAYAERQQALQSNAQEAIDTVMPEAILKRKAELQAPEADPDAVEAAEGGGDDQRLDEVIAEALPYILPEDATPHEYLVALAGLMGEEEQGEAADGDEEEPVSGVPVWLEQAGTGMEQELEDFQAMVNMVQNPQGVTDEQQKSILKRRLQENAKR